MARRKKPEREVTSTTDACPKTPKPTTGGAHQPLTTRAPRLNQTHIIALGLISITLVSVFSAGQWYMFMVPLQENTIITSTVFGGPAEDGIRSLIQLEDGGFIVAGTTASWGLGGEPYEPLDFWLVRLDENLNILWNQTYGTNGTEWYPELAVCQDGGFALAGYTVVNKTGSYDADVLLVRTDENGNHLWNQTLGGEESDYPSALLQCEDGGFAITGSTYNYGAGNSDAWLLRTDSTGTPLWNYTYGGSEQDSALDFVKTDSGFLLAGSTDSYATSPTHPDAYLICTDNDGNLLWNRTYGDWQEEGFGQIISTRTDGYLLSGFRGNPPYGNIWFVHVNALGDVLWEKDVGLAGAGGAGIVECQDGGFAVVGGYSGSLYYTHGDLYLARTDTVGNTLWGRLYGPEDIPAGGHDILQLADGSFLIAGGIQETPTENPDAWLLHVTDVPIMHYTLSQAVLTGLIISVTVLIIAVVTLTYYFLRKRRRPTE